MKRNPFRRIAVRLVLWHSGSVLLLLALLAALLYTQLGRAMRHDLDDELRETGRFALTLVELEHPGLVFEATEPGRITPDRLPGAEGHYELMRLIDGRGKVVSASSSLADLPVSPKALAVLSPGSGLMETARLGPEEVRVHTVPVLKGGRRIGTLQVVTSLEPVRRTLGHLVRLLEIAGLLALAVAVLTGQRLARRALDPVRAITRAAQTTSATSLSERLNLPDTGDELGYLAGSFDGMLDRIEAAYRRQREFAADASHELRTPLALIKGEASLAARSGTDVGAMRAALRRVEEEADRMTAMVEDLLLLARLDRGELPRSAPVGLDELAHDTAGRLAPLADERGLRLRVEASAPVVVRGDEASLSRVLQNLVRNAVEHTAAGEVCVTVGAEDGSGVVRVSDTGCGIPDSHRDRVFDRFYRIDSARSGGGAGLGLSLCREIVQAHGGTIRLESEEGRGTTVTFGVPLVDGA